MYSERRYSATEKGNNSDNGLMGCNTLMATKLIGLQSGKDTDRCRDQNLLSLQSSNNKVKRHIMTTYGTYGTKPGNVSDWSKQMKDLEDAGALYPRALKRQMVLIIRFNHNS